MNKTRVIASLSAGSGSTKRIASFIAYCVIIDQNTTPVVRSFMCFIRNMD